MKAMRYYETGAPEVLRLEDIPKPEASAGHVLIKVETLGINYSDVLQRRGDFYPFPIPLPRTTGIEVCGIVEAVGPAAPTGLVGKRVLASVEGGAAEYCTASANLVFELPHGLDPVEGVALYIHGMTAAGVLRLAGKLEGGQTVFVEAAGGGVGSLVVQLAKLWGASMVIGGASTELKRAFARSCGADHVIDHRQPDYAEQLRALTGGRGVDLVLHSAGGHYFDEGLKALAPHGRIVVYGTASGAVPALELSRLFHHSLAVAAFTVPSYFDDHALLTDLLDELADLVRLGRLKVNIAEIFPLERLADAHRMMESGTVSGKLVVKI